MTNSDKPLLEKMVKLVTTKLSKTGEPLGLPGNHSDNLTGFFSHKFGFWLGSDLWFPFCFFLVEFKLKKGCQRDENLPITIKFPWKWVDFTYMRKWAVSLKIDPVALVWLCHVSKICGLLCR